MPDHSFLLWASLGKKDNSRCVAKFCCSRLVAICQATCDASSLCIAWLYNICSMFACAMWDSMVDQFKLHEVPINMLHR